MVIKKYLILDTFILLNLNSLDKEYFLKNKSKEKEVLVKDKDYIKSKRLGS